MPLEVHIQRGVKRFLRTKGYRTGAAWRDTADGTHLGQPRTYTAASLRRTNHLASAVADEDAAAADIPVRADGPAATGGANLGGGAGTTLRTSEPYGYEQELARREARLARLNHLADQPFMAGGKASSGPPRPASVHAAVPYAPPGKADVPERVAPSTKHRAKFVAGEFSSTAKSSTGVFEDIQRAAAPVSRVASADHATRVVASRHLQVRTRGLLASSNAYRGGDSNSRASAHGGTLTQALSEVRKGGLAPAATAAGGRLQASPPALPDQHSKHLYDVHTAEQKAWPGPSDVDPTKVKRGLLASAGTRALQ